MKFLPTLVSFALQIRATAGVAYKRLLTQPALSLVSIVGLMVASGFILSVPLYADATYFRLLREELLVGREIELTQKPVDYAPLSFVFEVKNIGRGSPQWSRVVDVDEYLSGEALSTIKLPITQMIRRFHTDVYPMFPPRNVDKPATQYRLTNTAFAFITPMDNSVIQVIDGAYPKSFISLLSEGDAVEAMAHEAMAVEFGVQVGDTYTIQTDKGQIPIYIVGLWKPVDPNAPYWEHDSNRWLLLDEETYAGIVSNTVDDELLNAKWNIVADGSRLHAKHITGLEERIHSIENRTGVLFPNTTLIESPLDALTRYQENTPTLTYLLFAFSVPILSLILAFLGLVSGLFVNQQRGEMAILRSRGASSAQVVGMSLLQGIILGTVALAGGIGLGYWIASEIGKARSFLDFGGTSALRISLTAEVLGYGLLGIGVILIIQFVVPTLSVAKNTIVTYKQERARSTQNPWWQKYWLDVILLVPAAYGLLQLQRQSKLVLTGEETIPNPLQNPLLLLVPALAIFSVALFTLRLVPRLMESISRLLEPSEDIGMLMAARYLARTPAFYSAPLVLLVLTLGLSAFTGSLARTLDSQLEKQMRYQVGADMNIYELGTTYNEVNPNPVYTFGPVEDHLSIPDVRAATPVGRFSFTAIFPNGAIQEASSPLIA